MRNFCATTIFAALSVLLVGHPSVTHASDEEGVGSPAEIHAAKNFRDLDNVDVVENILDDVYVLTREDDDRDFSGIVRQTTEYTCGPAALATAIVMMGGSATEMEIADVASTTSQGTSMLSLKNAAKIKGYGAVGIKMSAEDLANRRGLYIAQVASDEINNHFVVIKLFNGESFEVADPLMGNVKIGFDDFRKNFKGNILEISLKADSKIVDPITGSLVAIDELSKESVIAVLGEISDEELATHNGKYAQLIRLLPAAVQKAVQSTNLAVTKSFVEDLIKHPDRLKAYTKIGTVFKKGETYYDKSSGVVIKIHDNYLVMYGKTSKALVNAYKISDSYVRSKLKKGAWIEQ